jgi:hypothetical protein
MLVNHLKSSAPHTRSKALARSSVETRQSYLLLAVGIAVALALPFLLQPRATASSGTPATAMSSHLLPTPSP